MTLAHKCGLDKVDCLEEYTSRYPINQSITCYWDPLKHKVRFSLPDIDGRSIFWYSFGLLLLVVFVMVVPICHELHVREIEYIELEELELSQITE